MCAKNIDKEAKAAEKAAAKAAAQEAKAAKAKTKTKAKRKNVGANEFNFFFLHGEKIGIAAAVGIFGMMLAGGAGLDPFTLTPEQITDAANKAEKHIDESEVTPQEYDEALVNYDYGEYAKLIKSAVTVNAYETPNRWEQSLFPDKNKRPSVKPLPVENLRAVACVGAIMYKELTANNAAAAMGGAAGGMGGAGAMGAGGPGGGMGGAGGMMGGTGGETKGRQWIAVTGSIPIRKQQAAYGDLFGNAQYLDDARDQPRYLYYELERGEVAPNGDVAWSKVDVLRAIKKENNQWNGVGSEQVGFSYHAPTFSSYPPMAMSCPPMANKPFGEEIANLPNIPLNSSEQIEVQSAELERWNKLQEAMNQIDESTLLDRDPFEGAGGSAMGGGMGGMDSGMAGGPGGMGASGGMGANGMGAGNDWLVNREAVAKQMLNAQTVASVDYYLFRYFDFEVEEGKTYQYRVKLLLANPNYGVEERFVEDPTATEQKIVASEFSEPSNPASLGRSARIFAQSVEAPSRPGLEPRVRLASIYFEQESATESLAQDLSMKLGQVANFKGKPHEAVNVAGALQTGMGGMGAASGMMAQQSGGRGGRGGRNSGKATVDHVSDACLVDAVGGAKISGAELRSPGKIMILEPNGYLQIREVKEDARELGRYDGSQSGGMGMGTGAAGMMM